MRVSTRARYWGTAVAVLALDQVVKLAVRLWLPKGASVPVVSGAFHLTHVDNTGAAFGVFPGGGVAYIVASAVACLYLGVFGPRLAAREPPLFWALACLFGGALGNLVDRVVFGAVTDFLDFRVWPVFNVADIALTVGAGLLVLNLVRYRDPPPEEAAS